MNKKKTCGDCPRFLSISPKKQKAICRRSYSEKYKHGGWGKCEWLVTEEAVRTGLEVYVFKDWKECAARKAHREAQEKIKRIVEIIRDCFLYVDEMDGSPSKLRAHRALEAIEALAKKAGKTND